MSVNCISLTPSDLIVETITAEIFYSGDPDTDGSWRSRVVGNRWIREYREGGAWKLKGGFS